MILEWAGSDELEVRLKDLFFSQIVFSPNLGRRRGLGGAEVGGDCDERLLKVCKEKENSINVEHNNVFYLVVFSSLLLPWKSLNVYVDDVDCLSNKLFLWRYLPNKRADNLQLLMEHLWTEVVFSFRERRQRTDTAESWFMEFPGWRILVALLLKYVVIAVKCY